MKSRTHFLVAFLAAAITFGSLIAFVGPENSGWNRERYGWRHHHSEDYGRDYRYERNNPSDSSQRY